MAKKKKSTLETQIQRETTIIETQSASLSEQIERSLPAERTKARQKSYLMDLRIHSPAALGYLAIEGIDTAPALVRLAKVKGLDLIAVTDYHCGRYIDRIVEAAKETEITVLPGVVIRCRLASCDDVILTCLFPEDYRTPMVEEFLRALGIPAAAEGSKQFIVNRPFDEILATLARYDGLALPSRMDKTPHRKSVIPKLVEDYGFRAFDLAYYPESKAIFDKNWPKLKFQLFSFSNANALAQIGSRYSKVKMPQPGFAGLRTLVERVVAV